jgi:hypothetical protein
MAQDRQDSRKSSGKKWSFFHKLNDAPVHVHFSHPEAPYIHPKTMARLPYRVGYRHFIPYGGKRGKGQMLDCGRATGEQCVVCAYENPEGHGLQNIAQQTIDQKGAQPYIAVAGWIEEEFHLVDVYNDPQNPGAGTHKERHQCTVRGCQECADGWPKVFGTRFYTELSIGQWKNVIHDLDRQIKNSLCRCGGKLAVPSFVCPRCQAVLVDVALTCEHCHTQAVQFDFTNDMAVCSNCRNQWSSIYTNYPDLTKKAHEKSNCPNCRELITPMPVRVCSTPNCPTDPYDIFDCQLVLRMSGVEKDRKLVVDSCNIQEPDARLFDPAFQGGDAMAANVAESHRKPLDLSQLLKAPTADEQAKMLRLMNPFNVSGRVAGASDYPKYARESRDTEAVE